jgi:multidrug efflux pump subunit AcrA (membrane-fusion protein)
MTSRVTLALAIPVLLAAGCTSPEAPPPPVRPVRAVRVHPGAAVEWLTSSGVTIPAERSEVAFRVSGFVASVEADVGDSVVRGQELARLDQRDFALAVSQIQGQLEQATSMLRAMESGERAEVISQLRAALEAARASYTAASAEYERYRTLRAQGVVSAAEFDVVEARYRSTQADVDAARSRLEEGQAGARAEDIDAQRALIDSLRAQLDTARNALADTVLTAPLDGRVVTRDIDPFEQVQAQQPVFTIQNLHALEMEIGVPEEIYRLRGRRDLQLKVRLNQVPGVDFEGTQVFFSADLDPRTQTYPVRVRFDNTDGLALPGMSGQVRLGVPSAASGEAVFEVPLTALFEQPDGTRSVWVVEGGRVHARPVQIDSDSQDPVIVRSGLSSGELVVTAGAHSLVEGLEVRLLDERSSGRPTE